MALVMALVMAMAMRKSSFRCLLAFFYASIAGVLADDVISNCERLKATLTYTQEQAPRDLSSVLPVVVEKVNRVLDGVVDVEVEWAGADLHGRVGEHIIECTVTRLASAVASENLTVRVDEAGREVTSQCFHVPFTILDTNECTLPAKHFMRHVCPPPSICVNTIGSYECLCPRLNQSPNELDNLSINDEVFWQEIDQQDRSSWELSFALSSKTSCPSSASTHGCCPAQLTLSEGQKCRSNFNCPVDPCVNSDCASNAICQRADSPDVVPNYSCQCPEGLMGNGHACQPKDPKPQPKVMYDGVTPTETTIKNNFYCGCTKPVVDACSGFPPCQGKHEICTVMEDNSPACACKPGYVHHEKYGCVDVHPPTLKLRHDPQGDQTLRLKQGDDYREYMVDIIDENAEDYLRSLKISYSQALPPGCLTQVGEFHVNYTVAMPWASPPYVRIQRRVIVDDIDECRIDISKYRHSCPPLVPQCDRAAGAKCINTIGSYACQCPSQSKGDGFLKSSNFQDFEPPSSYQGGTSCVDTSKPVITLNGPNPKIFKICECGGLSGYMSQSKSADNSLLESEQRKLYEEDIKEMIRATSGAELCASHDNPNPTPSSCTKAIDHTYQGDVDLSDRVVVGEPIQKDTLHWAVPYDVKDDAGNKATTVWRDVIVQEVDLASVESTVRKEMEEQKEIEIQRAVQRAIREERIKWDKEQKINTRSTNRRNGQNTCPACPSCDCPSDDGTIVSRENCRSYCDNISRSCTLSDDSLIYSMLFFLEDFFPPSLVPTLLAAIVVIILMMFIRFLFNLIFSPRSQQRYDYGLYDNGGDEMLLRGPSPMQAPGPPPPREALSINNNFNNNNNNAFFSPSKNNMNPPPPMNNGGGMAPMQQQPSPGNRADIYAYDDSIFSSPPIITPSRTGDGIRRRSPYT